MKVEELTGKTEQKPSIVTNWINKLETERKS